MPVRPVTLGNVERESGPRGRVFTALPPSERGAAPPPARLPAMHRTKPGTVPDVSPLLAALRNAGAEVAPFAEPDEAAAVDPETPLPDGWRLYNLFEVASILQIEPDSVYKILRKHGIPYVKVKARIDDRRVRRVIMMGPEARDAVIRVRLADAVFVLPAKAAP